MAPSLGLMLGQTSANRMKPGPRAIKQFAKLLNLLTLHIALQFVMLEIQVQNNFTRQFTLG